MKILTSILIAIFAIALPSIASATTYTWVGPTPCANAPCGGGWAVALNWSPAGIPGTSATDVVIVNGGTSTDVTGATGTIGGLTMTGANTTITTTGALTVSSGTVDLASGSIYGTLSLSAGVSTTIGSVDLNAGTLNNAGTVTWTAGTIVGANGTVIHNSGTWNMTAGPTSFSYDSGTDTADFYNTGTVSVGGTGTTNDATGYWGFHNAGTLTFTGTGTLEWQNSGNTTSSLDDGGQITGSGTLLFDDAANASSRVTVAGTTTLGMGATLALDVGASLSGAGPATLKGPGTLRWSAGVIQVGAQATPWAWDSALVVHMTSGGVKDMPGGYVSSQATVTWDGGDFGGTGNAVFVNGGTFSAAGDLKMNYSPQGGTNDNVFQNTGTFTKTSGSGNLVVNPWTFSNSGTVNGASGTIELQAGANAAALLLQGGTLQGSILDEGEATLGGNVTVSSSSTFELGTNSTLMLAATLDGAGSFGGSGTVKIDGAAINAGATEAITFAQGLNVSFTANATTTTFTVDPQGSLTFAGTTSWTGGNLEVMGGTVVSSGTWTASTAGTFSNNSSGSLLSNTGTFIADPGASATVSMSTPTTNSGTFTFKSGTTRFGFAGYVQTAGTTALAGGSLAANDGSMPPNYFTVDVQGGTLTGTGTIDAIVTNEGTFAPGTPTAAGTLTVTQTYAQGGTGTLAVALGGTTAGTQFDVLAVNGDVTLMGTAATADGGTVTTGGGTLAVALLGGYAPSVNDTYKVLTSGGADNVAGTFDTVKEPTGVTLKTTYDPKDVTLGVTAVSLPDGGAPDAGAGDGGGSDATATDAASDGSSADAGQGGWVVDGGEGDAGGDAGGSAGNKGSSCSCDVVGSGETGSLGMLALLGAALAGLSRRNRRR